MKKTITAWIFVWVFVTSTFVVGKAHASEKFSVSANARYILSETGSTHVSYDFVLTNKSSEYYVPSFTTRVGFEKIINITGKDQGGSIQPKLTKAPDGHTIEAAFNKHAVGVNSSQRLVLEFDTPDIAHKQGSIWEVNIPGVSDKNDYDAFIISVLVPTSFGKIAYVKPSRTPKLEEQSGYYIFTFSKDQLERSSIAMAFGTNQYYAFQLSYHIQNNNLFPIKTEIALPPSTNYQEVYVATISEHPTTVYRDSDGNWLGQYFLMPFSKKKITVTGTLLVSLVPRKEKITKKEFATYTKERDYWNISDKEIQKTARSLKTPRAIYDYVVNFLKYDFNRVVDAKPRLGATKALEFPDSAVCLEFTDLFIALARAADIPAREVNGFAFTDNLKQRPLYLTKDILHVWPEYYDTKSETWVMIDPTWANTTGGVDYFNTLDFDHVAFVIRGQDSTYPHPPGAYKGFNNRDEKDVNIRFASTKDAFEKIQKFELKPVIPSAVQSGMPISFVLVVRNTGNVLLDPQNISVSSDLTPSYRQIKTGPIPPFGEESREIRFYPRPFLTNQKSAVRITAAGKTAAHQLAIVPVYLPGTFLIAIGGVIGVLLAVYLSVVAFRARRLPVS